MSLRKFSACLLIGLLMITIIPCEVQATNTEKTTYIYDSWTFLNNSIPAYQYERSIGKKDLKGIPLGTIDDVYCSKDKLIMVDTKESRVHVFNTDFQMIKSIKVIRNSNNKIVVDKETNEQLVLNHPEGVCFDEIENELYIADTEAERIIVLDGDGYYLKRIIVRPEGMLSDNLFKPSKIEVDKNGRIYVLIQNSNEGLIEINADGSFSRFFGVNKPKVNILDYLWKSIASSEQKEKMGKIYAPSLSNLTMDKKGFVYTTTFDEGAECKVNRFNYKGENILLENGYDDVGGDSMFYTKLKRNQLVDIAVTDFGAYAVLDKLYGRVFLYNYEGYLMSIFNSKGILKGQLSDPSSLALFGDKIVITDRAYGTVNIYSQTDFGRHALLAEKYSYDGEWENSYGELTETIKINSNYDMGYIGIGKYYFMKDDYEQAMRYFKLGHSTKDYSKAYNQYRNLEIQKNFIWFALIAVTLLGLLFYSEYKYNRKESLGQ